MYSSRQSSDIQTSEHLHPDSGEAANTIRRRGGACKLALFTLLGAGVGAGGCDAFRPGKDPAVQERLAELEKTDAALRAELQRILSKVDDVSPEKLMAAIERTRSALVAVGPIEQPASGFFINDCEYIVTNQHVTGYLAMSGAATDGQFEITVGPRSRGEKPFTFYATLEKVGGREEPLQNAESPHVNGSDFAVLRVPESVRKDIPDWVRSIEFRDCGVHPIRDGETAIVVGNPYGLLSTVTVGHVSNAERHFDVHRYQGGSPDPMYPVVQVDAEMNNGSSGGLTVDADGKLIGVSFYGFGAGLHQARHVLNLKDYLDGCGIDVAMSTQECAMLGRWKEEWKAMQGEKMDDVKELSGRLNAAYDDLPKDPSAISKYSKEKATALFMECLRILNMAQTERSMLSSIDLRVVDESFRKKHAERLEALREREGVVGKLRQSLQERLKEIHVQEEAEKKKEPEKKENPVGESPAMEPDPAPKPSSKVPFGIPRHP